MQTKINIGDFVWVLFKVKEINVTNKDIIKYSLEEVSDCRKGTYLANKREEELVPANFKEEYDVESGTYRTTVYRLVDAEEKKGEWEDVSMGPYDLLLFRCSNCLKKSPNKSKYCPNCGAKMKEEGE